MSIDNSLIGALKAADSETLAAASDQFGAVRMKFTDMDNQVRSLTEQVMYERSGRQGLTHVHFSAQP